MGEPLGVVGGGVGDGDDRAGAPLRHDAGSLAVGDEPRAVCVKPDETPNELHGLGEECAIPG